MILFKETMGNVVFPYCFRTDFIRCDGDLPTHEERQEVEDWCRENFGSPHSQESPFFRFALTGVWRSEGWVFSFADEKAAILFKLRWC